MRDLEQALRHSAPAAVPPAFDPGELADVSYAQVDSPLGPLVVAATRRGLVRVAYEDGRLERVLAELAERVSPRVLEAPGALDEHRRQFEDYFAGRRREFDLPVDWRLHAGFGARVLQATARVPAGEVVTYRDVATRAGSPKAVRAAGNALGSNRIPIVVPCHRIVRTGGGLGGYTGGLHRKEFLLRLEGWL